MHFQTNVILTQEDADWLDEQILAFRKNNRKSLSPQELHPGLKQQVPQASIHDVVPRERRCVERHVP
jgi:hypothetical protein